MSTGATTPEQLETLFEDSLLLRDRQGLAGLFEEGALLTSEAGRPEARGGEQIARWASAMWNRKSVYVAELLRVLQARDTALVMAGRGISVVRRAGDGAWRYAISLPSLETTRQEEL